MKIEMMESLRRVTATIFMLAALVSGITVLTGAVVSCPVGTSCLGAVLTFSDIGEEDSLTVKNSTPTEVSDSGFDIGLLNRVIQSVSVYALLAAAVVLIVLETKELHYLKELSLQRRRRGA